MKSKKVVESGNIFKNSKLFYLLFFVVLFIVVVSLFSSFVFSDKGLYGSDPIQSGMFYRNFYAEYYQETGKVPVWNPYQFCGIPYIECFHGDTFYPFSKLLLFTNLFRAWGWNLLIHVFFAGITMFFCARVFGRSQIGSAMAAVSYMFASYFISQVAPGHDGKMFVTALFPLTLAFIELGFVKKPLVYFSLLGLTIGLIILTPHPQMAYYSLWACAFYTAYKLIFLYLDSKSFSNLIKPTSLFVLAVIIGLAISAIHFYPGYQYVKKYSPRSDTKRGEEWAKSWSIHPEEAFSMIVPEFCGVSGEKGNSYWGRNAFKDNSEYAGVIPLLLAIVAVAMIRNRKTWFFGGLAIFALIYAMAGNTWFFYLFYNLIPNVKSTRAWSMILFLFSFSTALLAAYAIDFIIEKSRRLRDSQKRLFTLSLFIIPSITLLGALFFYTAPSGAAGIYKSIFYNVIPAQKMVILNSHLSTIAAGFLKTFFFTSHVAMFAFLYSRRTKLKPILLWLIVIFALWDSFRFGKQFIRTYDPNTAFAKTPVIEVIKNFPGKFRVLDLSNMLPHNYLPFFGIENTTSFHGSEPSWYHNLLGGAEYRNRHNLNLMNMTNTRYVMVSPRSLLKGKILDSLGFRVIQRIRNLEIYENPFANDRAYIIHNWIIEPDDSKANKKILMTSFNTSKSVCLPEDPGIAITQDSAITNKDLVNIVKYENDYIMLNTKSEADGILVLADNWYPAWKGFIDDNEVDVMKVNAAFRGIVLPAGEHKVEFKFISDAYFTGKMLTLGGLLFVLAGVLGGALLAKNKNGVAAGGQQVE